MARVYKRNSFVVLRAWHAGLRRRETGKKKVEKQCQWCRRQPNENAKVRRERGKRAKEKKKASAGKHNNE
jgi:hypothetical protein